MTYSVKEIYYTLQGEGANSGRAAVFCRFAGCNLWTGREEDRDKAVCKFCDTDFIGTDGPGGGKFLTAEELAAAVATAWNEQVLPPPVPLLAKEGEVWREPKFKPLVVCTGGEPLLQLDKAAIEAFHAAGFEVAVETNGTQPAPDGLDWICVSPKAGATFVQTQGSELKLVYPQPDAPPEMFESLNFDHFFLQPMDGPDVARNIQLAIEYCLKHPQWRLSLQTHKMIGIR